MIPSCLQGYKFPFILLQVCTLLVLLFSCGSAFDTPNSSVLITDIAVQSSTYRNLVSFINDSVSEQELKDSTVFLVLPVQASCPPCRKKTIDSLMKHKDKLLRRHYVIISAAGGKKTINSYFKEQDYELPEIDGKLFLDSLHQAHKYELFKDNPAIYYAFDRKVYRKVTTIPATVREDLQEFFSGAPNSKTKSE